MRIDPSTPVLQQDHPHVVQYLFVCQCSDPLLAAEVVSDEAEESSKGVSIVGYFDQRWLVVPTGKQTAAKGEPVVEIGQLIK